MKLSPKTATVIRNGKELTIPVEDVVKGDVISVKPGEGISVDGVVLSGNIKPSCIQAAQEALNGVTNVGDALHFRRVGKNQGFVIGNHVFW